MPAKTITTDTDGVPSHGTCSTSGDGTPPMSAVPRHTPPLPHIHPHTHVQDFRATYFDEASLNQALELYEIGDTFGVAQLLVSMSTSRVTPLVVPHRTPAGPRSRSGSGIMEGAAASNPVQTISTRTLHTNARAWELLGRSYEHSERLLEARRSFYHAAQLYREHGQYLLHAQYLECRMLAVSTAPSIHFCSTPWEGTTHKLKALEKVESILASLPSTMASALTLPAVTSLTLRTPSVQSDLLGWMKLRAFRVTLNAHLGRWAEVLQLGRALLQDLELSPEHSAEASIVDRVAMLKQEVHHVYVTTALALHLDHYPKRMQTLGGNVESGLIPLHDDVLGLIKAGLQICPRCYHTHSTLLRLWKESGETSRAIEYVDTLIATHSSASDTCSTSHRMLYLWIREKSMLLAQQGNVEEALAVLQDSIRSARRVYQTAHYPSIFPTRSPAASSFLERKMTAPSLGSLASNTPHTGSTTPCEARGDPCFFTTFSSSQSQHNTPPTTSLPAQLPSAGPLALGTNAHGGLEKHSVFPSSESLDGPGAGGNSETQSDPCSVGDAAMKQGTPATSTTPPLVELTDRIAAHGVVAPPPALPLYCACVLLHLQRGDGEAARDALNSVVNDYPTFAHSMHDTPNEWQLLRTQVLRKCGIEYLERNRVGEFLSHLIRTTVPPRATSLEDEESDGKGNGEEDAASAREEPFPTGVEFISGLSVQMVSSSEEKNAVVGMELVQTLQRIVDVIECRTNTELTVKE